MMEDLEKHLNNSYKKSSFVNVITNEKGQKYYLYVLEYFKKIEINEYQKIYKTDTVKEYMKLKPYVIDSVNKTNENTSNTSDFNPLLNKKK